MPQLDTLKKQAKQLVRWHKDRVWTVAERIRTVHPKFAERSDREIMAGRFVLADAQEILAREHGFSAWTELKANIATLPERPAPALPEIPVIGTAQPVLLVGDLDATCRWFEARLGFATVFTYGKPAFYGQVARDAARIDIRATDMPVFVGDIREREQLISAVMVVQNVKALFEEVRGRGAEFYQELTKHPWGAQDFVVRDPDGNLISFTYNSSNPD